MSQSLWAKITTEQNFFAAWQKVRSNLGAPGIDRVSLDDFEKNLHDNLALLRALVVEGTYQSLPYLTFTHKKESGKDRTLRIPTVRDRVVQQAVLLVIQTVFEKLFLNCSYAYRPGKSSHQAIARVERNLQRGRVWVVDADIENFFDEVEQELLMKFLAETITETPLLKLVAQCISSSSSGGSTSQDTAAATATATATGLPQGAVLAPMLSNIYLHRMDDRMFRAEWNYIRYSDNILILCKSEEEAKAAMSRAEECLVDLRLKFNPDKTSLRHLREGFSFLGFYFDERGKRPDAPAVQRLNQRVETAIKKAGDHADERLRDKIESIVRGWLNYFKLEGEDRAQLLQQLQARFAENTDSLPQNLLKAALAYQLGDREAARETLRRAPVATAQDAQLNFQWGVLCEALGFQSEALDSYLAAYRLNAEHPEAAYQLGLHYLQTDKFDQALRYLQKAVQLDPQNGSVNFAIGTVLQRLGLHGAARKSLQRATALDPKLHKLLPQPEPSRASRTAPRSAQPESASTPTEEDLALFLRLFNGREGVYSRQWTSDDGRMGYNAIYRPLTSDELRSHLSGRQTLGYYLMRTDNTVSQLVFDLDLTKQVRSEIAKTSSEMKNWQNFAWQEARKLLDILRDLQLKAYVEDSGYKGLHLWLFFGAPLPGRDVVLLAQKVLALAGAPPPGLTREYFPREERIAPQALGPMVKLPLGVHKLTNRRCLFLDLEGEPATDQFALLRSIEPVSNNQFYAALEKAKLSLLAPTATQPQADRAEVDKIFAGCNVLRHFQERAERTKWLNHTERLTVAAVFGHMGLAGHQTVHEIIQHTTNYNYRITQKWLERVKGYPISCPKIRERHNDVTPVVGCCCQFPQIKNSYPSPVLHADPQKVVQIKARNSSGSSRSSGSEKKNTNGRSSSSIPLNNQLPLPLANTTNQAQEKLPMDGHFKDLKVYQMAYALAMEIFHLSKAFPKEEIYSLTSQIRRASRSVCLNLAEAYRKRNYPNHFASKCTDADAEASETTVALDFAKDCGYITADIHQALIARYEEVGKMLNSMIRHPEKFLPKKS